MLHKNRENETKFTSIFILLFCNEFSAASAIENEPPVVRSTLARVAKNPGLKWKRQPSEPPKDYSLWMRDYDMKAGIKTDLGNDIGDALRVGSCAIAQGQPQVQDHVRSAVTQSSRERGNCLFWKCDSTIDNREGASDDR
jgi:hypothetical protein